MRSPFAPTRHVASVSAIDIEGLAQEGVRCVLLDRDNTCIPRDTRVAPPEVVSWLEAARAHGMRTCLVSNNFHTRQIEDSARELGCEVVHHAMKPAPFAVEAALVLSGVPAEEAVLVGDQVFTDVVAGNLAGVRTILVHPQSTTDLWYTQILRLLERPFIADVRYEGEETR